MTYDKILSHFEVVHRYDSKAKCRCPAHNDRQASLTISKGQNSTLLHCHAGCNYKDILSELLSFNPKISLFSFINSICSPVKFSVIDTGITLPFSS